MKDVTSCIKFWRAARRLWTRNIRMRLRTSARATGQGNAGNGNILVPAGKEINRDAVSKSDWKQPRANWICSEMKQRCGVVDAPLVFVVDSKFSGMRRRRGWKPRRSKQTDESVSWVLHLGNDAGIWGILTSNPKHELRPIAYEYCEGKLKSTHNRELKVPET